MAWRDWKIVKFFFESKPPVEENINQHTVTEATSKSKAAASTIKKVGYNYGGNNSSLTYESATGFSFDEIEKAYLTDSYIRQAVDKYVDFMFKAGWDIVGKNPNSVQYIKQRLAAMALAVDKPLSEFFVDIADDLIKYNNVFLLKARASNSYTYPQGLKVTPVLSNKPIAGYFTLPVSSITIARDTTGLVKKYKQTIGSNTPLEINPADMIHVVVDRPTGRAFGFPFLAQVLDDIKLLRQLEELTDRMVYKNLFPLLVYKVGLEQEGFQATDDEIEEVKAMLGEITLDGGIVVPERHKIESVTVQPMDVIPILNFFKKRVFTGLGVSATIMGEADTANKSTSDNLDQMFKDRIKAYQKIMGEYITSKVFYELLTEGGFDPTTNPDDNVEFRFKEIDLAAKMAEQNHMVQLFTQNAITHEELRTALGYEAVTPDDESRLSFKMIQAYQTELEAQLSASTSAADAATTAANNAGQNKNQPANQHGARSSAKTTKNSAKNKITEATNKPNNLVDYYSKYYDAARNDVIRNVQGYISKGKPLSEFSSKELDGVLSLAVSSMATQSKKYISQSFINGVERACQEMNSRPSDLNYTRSINLLTDKVQEDISSVMKDVFAQVERILDTSSQENYLHNINGVFVALQYRLKFISNTQINSAYNMGFVKAAVASGYSQAYLVSDDAECMDKYGPVVNLLSDAIPPYHPNCLCKLTLIKKEDST